MRSPNGSPSTSSTSCGAGAGRGTLTATITPTFDEQTRFGTFSFGVRPNFFPGVQFSGDSEALDQSFRQITSDTGPLDPAVTTAAVVALFKRIGPGILV